MRSNRCAAIGLIPAHERTMPDPAPAVDRPDRQIGLASRVEERYRVGPNEGPIDELPAIGGSTPLERRASREQVVSDGERIRDDAGPLIGLDRALGVESESDCTSVSDDPIDARTHVTVMLLGIQVRAQCREPERNVQVVRRREVRSLQVDHRNGLALRPVPRP